MSIEWPALKQGEVKLPQKLNTWNHKVITSSKILVAVRKQWSLKLRNDFSEEKWHALGQEEDLR